MVLVLDLGDGWLLDAQQSSSGLYNIDGAEQSGADSDATTGPAPDRVVLVNQSYVSIRNGDPCGLRPHWPVKLLSPLGVQAAMPSSQIRSVLAVKRNAADWTENACLLLLNGGEPVQSIQP